jgi:hypothetical protein
MGRCEKDRTVTVALGHLQGLRLPCNSTMLFGCRKYIEDANPNSSYDRDPASASAE